MARITRLEQVLGRYRTIYLDPPWPYDRRVLGRRALDEIYAGGVMSLEDLGRLPIARLGREDDRFYVWMWCTWPKIRDGFHQEVLDAWKLKWVSEIVWDKVTMGQGRRMRKQTEILLLAVPAGQSSLLLERKDQRDLVQVRRGTQHSGKPEEFRRLIETLTPEPRIELFARSHPPSWDVWGLEAPEEQEEPVASADSDGG